ncbi:30S ribosomal protein S6e [Candidatus Woesearchaeota archaeon]|nr:30S ribosomal protein S6e [Candidatus Woesearchaeota archaeon]
MAFKLVISDPKTGSSVQKEADDEASKGFLGLKIGDSVKGELINLTGYEFLLTGGSDYCGFPMRKDVPGVGRKKILAYNGVGVRKLKSGILQRKTVCGNTVHPRTAQINLKVVKQGSEEIFRKSAEGKQGKEEPKAAESKADEKKAEKAAEKPADKKEQPRASEPKAAELKAEPKNKEQITPEKKEGKK